MFEDWKPELESGEPASFMFGRFDVRKAKQIVKARPRESEPLVVADYAALLKMVTGVSHTGVNLDVPIMAVKVGAGLLPIDGWSRITEATRQGIACLPCVILTAEETKSIRIA